MIGSKTEAMKGTQIKENKHRKGRNNLCVLCVIYGQSFLYKKSHHGSLLFCLRRKSESNGFSKSRLISQACWKVKYLVSTLDHSESVALVWNLGISIFNKLQKWFKYNWPMEWCLGTTKPVSLKKLSYFSLWEKYLMVIPQTSLFFFFWDGKYSYTFFKVREIEEVRITV